MSAREDRLLSEREVVLVKGILSVLHQQENVELVDLLVSIIESSLRDREARQELALLNRGGEHE